MSYTVADWWVDWPIIGLLNVDVPAAFVVGYVRTPMGELLQTLPIYTFSILVERFIYVQTASYAPHEATALHSIRLKMHVRPLLRSKATTDLD